MFFASIPSHSYRHSSTETQSKLCVVNFLSLRHSFLFTLPLCSFKFMLMSLPNRISESIDWERLQWVLKVIGLQVSHTWQFSSRGFSLPPILQWASASFIQTINTPAHRCSSTLQRWEGRSTRMPEEINQCEMTNYHSSFYPLPLTFFLSVLLLIPLYHTGARVATTDSYHPCDRWACAHNTQRHILLCVHTTPRPYLHWQIASGTFYHFFLINVQADWMLSFCFSQKDRLL